MKTLPFITLDDAGVVASHWSPARSGDYAVDCATGRDYARQFSERAPACVLPWVIRAMPRGDDLGGVEIGFLAAIAGAAGAP